MPQTSKHDSLIAIFGDQLCEDIHALRLGDREKNLILMAEVMDEATYAHHHKKKLAFVFSAMRHFAEELTAAGWTVRYIKLDDPKNTGSLTGEIERALREIEASSLLYTEASEYRLASELNKWAISFGITPTVLPDDRFIVGKEEFGIWASGRKQLRMEHFYREVRRKTNILMDDGKPVEGKWNFDSENRSPAPNGLAFKGPRLVEPDQITQEVLELVERVFPGNVGVLKPFSYAVTRNDALRALEDFVKYSLPNFGTYQDAMLEGEPFLFHSVLSQYINFGLLQPLEVCLSAEAAWRSGAAPINAVEGFIRQIIGWREFIRGIYWLKMPGYIDNNFFAAKRSLPQFYWDGNTEMACLRAAIGQTLEHSYAHHIQRLMVTGNFAMLAGVNPLEVHQWYLSVYADALEWVEAPNVIGMSQFADGGVFATKPYAASGNYINKMSNHCADCRFDVKIKTGDGACPFNFLYWDFIHRNTEKLSGNARLGNVYRTWSKMSTEKQNSYIDSAADILGKL